MNVTKLSTENATLNYCGLKHFYVIISDSEKLIEKLLKNDSNVLC